MLLSKMKCGRLMFKLYTPSLRTTYLQSLQTTPFRYFVSNPIDLEKRKKEKEDKQFREDIKYFLGKETFTLHDFHERVKTGLKEKSTFKMMVYGEDQEVKVLEGQNKVLCAMYDEEKSDPSKISKDIIREVCEVSQLKIDDVKDVINKYNQLKGFHKFLIKRREKGEPMPENSDELMDIYRYEKPSFLMNKNKEQKYSKRQREYLTRRKYT